MNYPAGEGRRPELPKKLKKKAASKRAPRVLSFAWAGVFATLEVPDTPGLPATIIPAELKSTAQRTDSVRAPALRACHL